MALAPAGEETKVVGVLEIADGSLEAPYSSSECAYYSCEIVFVRGDQAFVYLSEEKGLPFWLTQEDMRAFVDPQDASVSAETTTRTYGVGAYFETQETEGLRARFPQMRSELLGYHKIRISESVLRPGREIAVVGYCHKKLDEPTAGDALLYRETMDKEMLVFRATAKHRLFISDAPKVTKS